MNNVNKFYVFCMCTMLFSVCSCGKDSVDLHLNVENPRQIGKEKFLLMVNGIARGESSRAEADTVTIREYICYTTILAHEESGEYDKVNIFTVDKSGFMESIVYKEIEQTEEVGFSPTTTRRIRLKPRAKEYTLLIRSGSEDTGIRVLRIAPAAISGISETNPLKVPDLKTLPRIEDDPDVKKLSEIRDGLKR